MIQKNTKQLIFANMQKQSHNDLFGQGINVPLKAETQAKYNNILMQ